MKLILDNVDITHKALLAEMAKALYFKVTEIKLTGQEEEQALYVAMQDGQKSGMATEVEKNEFEMWLFNN